MARIQQIMFSNCTEPAREDEFNRWYSHSHLPDLSVAPGFVFARRFVNAMPNRGAARYMAVYEFEAESAEVVLRNLTTLALDAFDKGRHIDCIEGVPAGNTPLGSQWHEIDAASLKPLPALNYPPASPVVRKQMLALIKLLDTPGSYTRVMRAPSTQWLMRFNGLWLKIKRLF